MRILKNEEVIIQLGIDKRTCNVGVFWIKYHSYLVDKKS